MVGGLVSDQRTHGLTIGWDKEREESMTTALLTRGTQFGEFRATGYVGSGGFSDVYEAFDPLGQRVALKVLRSKTVLETVQQSRIERERDILAALDTRGVARLIDADFQSDPPWIASDGSVRHDKRTI